VPAGFSTLLSAVKPRERTDQYVVLAAMHSLGAEATPVSAKQIRDLLKLHLGNKVPSNINACLRTYTAYVEPADPGPPLQWRLKPEGTSKLRSLSDLALAVVEPETAFGTDVGIVCALEQPEFDAVQKAFGGAKVWKEVGDSRFTHLYRETTLTITSGKSLRVLATVSTSMGLTAAAIVTTQLILQFRPRLVVMIGIAAGTRSGTSNLATYWSLTQASTTIQEKWSM